jgi:hypothetical protein
MFGFSHDLGTSDLFVSPNLARDGLISKVTIRFHGLSLDKFPLDRMIAFTAKAVDRAYRRTERQQHNDKAGATFGALAAGKILYHVCYDQVWIVCAMCNRYANESSLSAKDHCWLTIAIIWVLSPGNTAIGVSLTIQVTQFAALFDKFV